MNELELPVGTDGNVPVEDEMMKFVTSLAGLVCLAFGFAGCNQHTNSMLGQPAGGAATAAVPAPASPGAPAPATNVPYVLSAQSAGPFVNFSIYNMGTTDLEVKAADFALIDPGSRDVVPYDNASAIIDLPQPAVVKPNGTLQGRAIFQKVTAPIGKRLVFKPDNVGTFADINRVSSMNGSVVPAGAAAAAPGGLAGTQAAPGALSQPLAPAGVLAPAAPISSGGDLAAKAEMSLPSLVAGTAS